MKCLCPACGRTTEIENELLEFFARCNRCGILLRPRPAAVDALATEAARPVKMTAKVVPVGRVREEPAYNSRLADLLSRPLRPAVRSGAPAVATAPTTPAAVAVPQVAPPVAQKYQAAIRRAELRQRHQVLGVAGVLGVGALAFLSLGALMLKSHTGPTVAHADVIRPPSPALSPPSPGPATPPQATSPR